MGVVFLFFVNHGIQKEQKAKTRMITFISNGTHWVIEVNYIMGKQNDFSYKKMCHYYVNISL